MKANSVEHGGRGKEGGAGLPPESRPQGVNASVHNHFDSAGWIVMCNTISAEALRSCGLSYDVFTGRYSEGIDRELELLPPAHRLRALRLAKLHGDYLTTHERAQRLRQNAEDGCCSHGITLGSCPAGCDSFSDDDESVGYHPAHEIEAEEGSQRIRPEQPCDAPSSASRRRREARFDERYFPSNRDCGAGHSPSAPRSDSAGRTHAVKWSFYFVIAAILATVSLVGFGVIALLK